MSTVDLNWFAVTALLKIHTEPRKRKKILYGIHQRHPAKFTPYNTVAVYNIPPGDKYENIKKLNEHLEHMPSICSFWYPELRLDESKYPEDTLFIGLAGDDVSNVLDHLPKVRDFGNVLVGERFTQQESSDIFGKLKMFSHIYMQIGLFDEVVVFRVGSRVSNTQYQEFRWVLDREIFYKPPDTDAGNPRIFTLKLSPACSCIEPEKHGDITSPEGQTINSITGMITSIIRDTLSREKGRVGFEFMLQYNKHDQSFREMLDPESRPPTEYWSDDGYPAIDSGSSSGSEPQEGSQSDNESHYHRTDTEPDQDLSRSRELSCSTSSSEDEDLSRSRELGCSTSSSSSEDQDNSTELALTPGRNPERDSDYSTDEERASREQSRGRRKSEERERTPSRGRGGSSSSSNWEWYQPPGYYRPKASTEQSRSCVSSRERSQDRSKSVEPGRTPRNNGSPCRSRSKQRDQSPDISSYRQYDYSESSSESNEGFSPMIGADIIDQMIEEEERGIETPSQRAPPE